jgi:HD-GYP domain-containing protein (c-di-GMP phosphodiesterase class II)
MAFLALPPDYLQLHKRIPFGVYDGYGRLLVAAGRQIDDEKKLALLQRRELFVNEEEAGALRESLKRSAKDLIRHNAPLGVIAAARDERQAPGARPEGRPEPRPAAAPPPMAAATAPLERRALFGREGTPRQRCEALTKALGAALREADAGPQWLMRAQAVQEGLRDFTEYHRNAALYLLFQHAAHSNEQYSTHHAVLCAIICEHVARSLNWLPEARVRIGLAALTMNVSMTQLQDQLALRDDPLRPVHKQQLATHPQRSADLLAAAGADDEMLLAIVRDHHDSTLMETPLAALEPLRRMTRLLMTVDRFAARISRRGTRSPMSPLIAARDLCTGEDGLPDEFGAAILRTIGMYPPGSYVRLVNGELGVVLAPGRRMNQPQVAVIQGTSGLPLADPVLRDTALAGREVVEAVRVGEVRVTVEADKALALL